MKKIVLLLVLVFPTAVLSRPVLCGGDTPQGLGADSKIPSSDDHYFVALEIPEGTVPARIRFGQDC